MSRFLITGATGTVGSALVELFRREGLPSRAASRHPDSDAGAMETVRFDFLDPSTFEGAFRGIERMFLVRPPALAHVRREIVPALDAARAAGVGSVTFLSILGAETLPFLPHARIERAIVRRGFEATFLRSSFFMQNFTGVHRDEIRDHDEIAVPAGRGRTSFIDARDVAEVAFLSLVRPEIANGPLDLTGRAALDYDEIAALFSQALGRRIAYKNPSLGRFLGTLRGRGTGWRESLAMATIYTTVKLGRAARVAPDAERVLRRPPRAFSEFVADHAAAWRPTPVGAREALAVL